MKKTDFVDQTYLIIGGTSKAATTALFNYLADHPQICASSAKETRFFLDVDYPLPSKCRYEEGIDKYLEYYECEHDGEIRLEASPDYLYSPNTARKIKDSLPNVKFIFVLREPMSRLISWFKFGKLMRKIPKSMTFDVYIDDQSKKKKQYQQQSPHPAFYALEQGRYSKYLKTYLDIFGREQLHICFFEDFKTNHVSFLQSICSFVNINAGFYNDYNFEATNQSFVMRSIYLHKLYVELRSRLRIYFYHRQGIRRYLKKMRYILEPIYYKLNSNLNQEISISDPTINFLKEYYKDEARLLTKMFGISPPWRK
jgi:hypothetical protein